MMFSCKHLAILSWTLLAGGQILGANSAPLSETHGVGPLQSRGEAAKVEGGLTFAVDASRKCSDFPENLGYPRGSFAIGSFDVDYAKFRDAVKKSPGASSSTYRLSAFFRAAAIGCVFR